MLVGNDMVQEAKHAYFGSALWRIIQFLAQGNSTFPSWSDMFDRKKTPEKEQTADEIKAQIIRDLRR